jgi:hypothetical protein
MDVVTIEWRPGDSEVDVLDWVSHGAQAISRRER